MFDKLYVLSKGGHCVYSGPPVDLCHHLADCGIHWTASQLPIEVLLKYSCNEYNDINTIQMVKKAKEIESQLIASRFPDETLVSPDGIRRLSKRFFLRDLWLLIKRGMTYNLRFYWKILLFQFCAYILFGLLLRVLFNPNIGRPSGCISFDDDLNNTCAKTETNLEDEKQLTANLKFNFYAIAAVVSTSMSATILSFAFDIKIFLNEQRNGRNFELQAKQLIKVRFFCCQTGWYSTSVLYWSKTIVELFPLIITIVCYSYVVDIYEWKNSMFLKYAVFLTIGLLELQSVSHIFGILTADNTRIAVFTIIGVFLFQIIFSNFFIPIRELHYSLQVLSNLSTLKLLMESVMIMFYGLGRCFDREYSYILLILDIKDKDFYMNLELLVIQFFTFRAIALIVLLLRVNPIVNSRKDQERRKNITENVIAYVKNNWPSF